MTRTLVIRGFDDKVHAQLGQLANRKGISINSIVRDAVDKWLKHQSEIPKKHYLIIYSDDDSIAGLLKSMDTLAREANLARCFWGSPDSPITKHLSKLNWYNGTVEPYPFSTIGTTTSATFPHYREGQETQQQLTARQGKTQKSIVKYIDKVTENIIKNADKRQVCCMDFMINDVSKSSSREGLSIEHAYDEDRISGSMYCLYKTNTLLNLELREMIELFEMHDQIFIVKDHEVYKLHVTKENVHKLFLN